MNLTSQTISCAYKKKFTHIDDFLSTKYKKYILTISLLQCILVIVS